jgi:pimeloyl-ACP methyl ester carboxylesterase
MAAADEVIDEVGVRFSRISTNGIHLHCAIAGPEDGPLVIALHGFPDFWRGMSPILVTLAKAGFRVVAPDQRGYNLSDKPEGIDAYRIDELSADIIGLIHSFGRTRAHIVGHDWGAAVAWWVALTRPDVVDHLVVINVPHPRVLAREIRSNPRQALSSWYIFALQIPYIPEALAFGSRTRAQFARILARSANPGSFDETYLQRLQQAWAQPGAGTAMANWYRASVRRRPGSQPDPRVRVPTLIVWGRRDTFLSATMIEPSADLCDDVRVEIIDDATHWPVHDQPLRTSTLIADFLPLPERRHSS